MNMKTLGTLCVALQFSLLAALGVLCLLEMPNRLPGGVAYTLWVCSAALGIWSLSANRPGNFNIHPEPKRGGRLVQHGPYAWVRHPMYGSVLLLAAGAAAWIATLLGLGLWILLLVVLITKASLEERWLVEQYPEYVSYQSRTKQLVPWLF